jgi:ribose 5-phosphate isomerase B
MNKQENSMSEKIHCALGADHRGYKLKEYIKQNQQLAQFVIWHDVGTDSEERTDYPIYTKKAVDLLQQKKVSHAVLLCGTGIGMAMAANRYPHCFAGVAWCPEIARRAKEEDNMNILVFGADYIDADCAIACIEQFLTATFKGGRYAERIKMIDTSGVK